MRPLRAGVDPRAFLARLHAAPSRVLLLDYDGTLAPFREERDRAFPYPEARDLVEAILRDGRTRVGVVSGRAVADLRPLLGLEPPPEIWGTHGWERFTPAGGTVAVDPGEALRGRLARAAAAALQVASRERVEVKPAAVALHLRGAEPAEGDRLAAAVGEAWAPLLDGAPLEVRPFDGGLELRAVARDKGTAVREALAGEPPGAAVAYLGDDTTDEDAFRALAGRGLSVLVRPELRPTAADLWLRPPEELLDFLRAWAHSAGPATLNPA